MWVVTTSAVLKSRGVDWRELTPMAKSSSLCSEIVFAMAKRIITYIKLS
jgi:hypothetical protein